MLLCKINDNIIKVLSIDLIKKLNYYELINYLSKINEIKEILDNNNIIKYTYTENIINIDNYDYFIKNINETTIITIVIIQKSPKIYLTNDKYNSYAFAAINNNNVITWGNSIYGGNSIKVQSQLRD